MIRRWPLVLIAAPAAVAVWSGWVGLGGMCGFGVIHPLPGILPGFQLNTAITLPVGVEAYGAYALGAWLAPESPKNGSSDVEKTISSTARTFARRSAVGALLLGMTGQVIYHLLAASGATRAPWPVVVLVSCMPVVTLGFGAALTHLLRTQTAQEPGQFRNHETLADRREVPAVPGVPEGLPAEAEPFAAELAAGQVPGIRRIRRELHVGQPKAQQVQLALAAYLEDSPAGASAIPRAPGPPAGVSILNGSKGAEH